MKLPLLICLRIALSFIISGYAFNTSGQRNSSDNKLFDSEDSLTINLKGNVRDLFNNRFGTAEKFPFTLSYYLKENNTDIPIPVEIKTRGHFRRLRENCTYPPLMIEFADSGSRHSTIFKEQKKLKLVMPCRGDAYIIREWLVYKIYNLLTPLSFRSRLVKIKMEDISGKKTYPEFYGLLLEEEKQMAERNNATVFETERKIAPEQTRESDFLTMSVFQYMVGNTDWSVQYLQNIRLLVEGSNPIPVTVPYDFDHAGIIDAPYAFPAEELQMFSVRQRRYRGYCMPDLSAFNVVLKKFNDLKNEFYKLYTGCTLLDAKYLKSTLQYLDEFYKTINDVKAWQREFAYPCDKKGTGNVVIKGLKED